MSVEDTRTAYQAALGDLGDAIAETLSACETEANQHVGDILLAHAATALAAIESPADLAAMRAARTAMDDLFSRVGRWGAETAIGDALIAINALNLEDE